MNYKSDAYSSDYRDGCDRSAYVLHSPLTQLYNTAPRPCKVCPDAPRQIFSEDDATPVLLLAQPCTPWVADCGIMQTYWRLE